MTFNDDNTQYYKDAVSCKKAFKKLVDKLEPTVECGEEMDTEAEPTMYFTRDN